MGRSKGDIARFQKKKLYENRKIRKDYIENIEKRAFSNTRAKFRNFTWEKGHKCYYEQLPTCLLEFVEEVGVENSSISHAKVKVDRVFGSGTTPIGTEFIVPYNELITITQLETEIQLLLKNDGYGEEQEIKFMKQLYADYKNSVPATEDSINKTTIP